MVSLLIVSLFFLAWNCCLSAQLPQEAPAVIPDRRPPSSWPSAGEIDIKNLTLKVKMQGVSFGGDDLGSACVRRQLGCARGWNVTQFFFLQACAQMYSGVCVVCPPKICRAMLVSRLSLGSGDRRPACGAMRAKSLPPWKVRRLRRRVVASNELGTFPYPPTATAWYFG